MQRTFGEPFDMPDTVPTTPHPDDQCEAYDDDGNIVFISRKDAYFDTIGRAYTDEAHRDECQEDMDIEDCKECLQNIVDAESEYTEHEDYGSNYLDCIDFYRLDDAIDEYLGDTEYEDRDKLIKYISRDKCLPMECYYQSNEYASYYGSDCCVDSWQVGEIEIQVEISSHSILTDLKERDVLEDILKKVDRDFCISRPHKFDSNYFYLYDTPGGCWHFVLPSDYINQCIEEFYAD